VRGRATVLALAIASGGASVDSVDSGCKSEAGEARARVDVAPGAAAVVVLDAAPTPTPTGTHWAPAPDRNGIELVEAPPGEAVESAVRGALARAAASKRTLVVYVGATWCEPCQRFHHAAEHGELDATFPTMTLLEFDLDRDGERLASAGYVSKYIPLFALPSADGRASGKQIEGGIKGDGAVAFIVPRLKEMLSD
jgi:hypothetical protein